MDEQTNILYSLGYPETMLDEEVHNKRGASNNSNTNNYFKSYQEQNNNLNNLPNNNFLGSVSNNNLLPSLLSMLGQKGLDNNMMSSLLTSLASTSGQNGTNLISTLLSNNKTIKEESSSKSKNIDKFKKIKDLN